jgi:hypothetical protein
VSEIIIECDTPSLSANSNLLRSSQHWRLGHQSSRQSRMLYPWFASEIENWYDDTVRDRGRDWQSVRSWKHIHYSCGIQAVGNLSLGRRLLPDTYLSSSLFWQWWVLRASVASRLIQGFPQPPFHGGSDLRLCQAPRTRRSLVFSLTLYRYVLLMRCLSPAVLFLENLPIGQSVCLDSLFRRNSCVFGNKKTHDRLPVPLLPLPFVPACQRRWRHSVARGSHGSVWRESWLPVFAALPSHPDGITPGTLILYLSCLLHSINLFDRPSLWPIKLWGWLPRGGSWR